MGLALGMVRRHTVAALLRPPAGLLSSATHRVPSALCGRTLHATPLLLAATRPGPKPRQKRVWEDPEAATREAMLQFVDPYEKDPDIGEPGRRWRAAELRLKSNEDLQKLWIVLMKERNMLHTTRLLHKKRKTKMPHLGRIQATRKSMAMIKVVLGERQRAKQERDERLAAERLRERALEQTDLASSLVWPPWIPGTPRQLQLAAPHTFTLVLPTLDGKKPSVVPPGDALAIEMRYKNELIPSELVELRVHPLPPARSRADKITYNCHVYLSGQALPACDFLRSEEDLGEPLEVALSSTLYGQLLGDGAVSVRVLPSKRRRRHAALAAINRKMSEQLLARKQAVEQGLDELP